MYSAEACSLPNRLDCLDLVEKAVRIIRIGSGNKGLRASSVWSDHVFSFVKQRPSMSDALQAIAQWENGGESAWYVKTQSMLI